MRLFPGYFALLFYAALLPGQTPHFDVALKEDQSFSGTVTCLLEDQIGFIWIGSTDGLFRYDGQEIRPFFFDKSSPHSLMGNRVYDMNSTKDGKILIGTDRGISMYDPATENFNNYRIGNGEGFGADTKALSVIEDSTGQIWYGSYEGLFQLDVETGSSVLYSPPMDTTSLPFSKTVWTLESDRTGRLWIGLNAGVAIYDPFEQKFLATKRPPFTADVNAWRADQVFNMAEQSDGTIWLGTGYGLWRCALSEEKLSFTFLPPKGPSENSLSGPFIEDIFVDRNDDLWIGTWANGLNKMVYDASSIDSFRITAYPSEIGLSDSQVTAILEDRSGVLWIGTGTNLYKYARKAQKIQSVGTQKTSGDGLTNAIIKASLTDRRGNLWVGTREGLNFLSAADKLQNKSNWIHFKKDASNLNGLRNNNIFGLFEDSAGLVWITTYGGLHYIFPEDIGPNPTFHRLTMEDGLPANFIYAITENEPGDYWISTYAKFARMHFDPSTGLLPKFDIYDSSPEDITALVNATCYVATKDRFGQTWVATYDGLSKVIEADGQVNFENYKNKITAPTSLTNNVITDLHLDQQGEFWVGTRMGLHHMVQTAIDSTVYFRHFGLSDGFRNEVIQFIREDQAGILWIGTNNGLVQFDPQAALRGERPVIAIFDQDDGLPSSGSVFRSAHIDPQGILYVGTGAGLAYFSPKQLLKNDYAPTVVFTGLKLQNEVVAPLAENNSILSQSITLAPQITLRHHQNMVEIKFAALDFHRPGKNQYRYRLIGFNEQWIDAGDKNVATFTNLNPGHYSFEVFGTNNDGVWSQQPATLQLRVFPPPWKTWWAYTTYALAFLSFLFGLFRWRLHENTKDIERRALLKTARLEERERLRRKNAADFHDELGHRLTKISLLLELVDRNSASTNGIKGYIDKIRKHANSLSEGVRDLIWGLDPGKDNLYETLVRLQEFGDRLFEFTDTKFRAEGIQPELATIGLSLDVKKQLLFLYKEAMNNALKHAEAKLATLAFHQTGNKIFFTFWDDGKGMSRKGLANSVGYGLGNMRMRAQKLGGELSISSSPEKGTSIRLALQIPQLEHKLVEE